MRLRLPRQLLAIFGLSARVRDVPPDAHAHDPELAAVRGKRVEIEASLDLLRLEAANLGVEEDDDAPGHAG